MIAFYLYSVVGVLYDKNTTVCRIYLCLHEQMKTWRPWKYSVSKASRFTCFASHAGGREFESPSLHQKKPLKPSVILLGLGIEFRSEVFLPVEELPDGNPVLLTPLLFWLATGITGLNDAEPLLDPDLVRYLIHAHRLLAFFKGLPKGDCTTRKAMHTVPELRPTPKTAMYSVAFLVLLPPTIISQGVPSSQVRLIFRLP